MEADLVVQGAFLPGTEAIPTVSQILDLRNDSLPREALTWGHLLRCMMRRLGRGPGSHLLAHLEARQKGPRYIFGIPLTQGLGAGASINEQGRDCE